MMNVFRKLTKTMVLIAGYCFKMASATEFLPVPLESSIPVGVSGDAIRMGKRLLTETRQLLPNNVGNGLNCTNCHLQVGTVAGAAPWRGIWGGVS